MEHDHLNRVDLIEGYSILSLVKIDVNNITPNLYNLLKEWIAKYEIKEKEGLLASLHGSKIKITIKGNVFYYSIDVANTVILDAVVLLINLANPINTIEVEGILKNTLPIEIIKRSSYE